MRRRQTDIFKPTPSSLLSSSLNLHHINNHLLKITNNNTSMLPPSSLESSSSLFLLDAIRNNTNIEPRIHHVVNNATTINRNNKTIVTPIQHQPSNENQNLLYNPPIRSYPLPGKDNINSNKMHKLKKKNPSICCETDFRVCFSHE